MGTGKHENKSNSKHWELPAVTDVGAGSFNQLLPHRASHPPPLTDRTEAKNTITFYFLCLVIKLRVLISKCLTL